MLDLQNISIAGMKTEGNCLWVASPDGRLVATYDPSSGRSEKKLSFLHEIRDVCPHGGQLWMITGGGRLGQQIVLWSLERNEELRRFDCPDGAGAGMTLYDGRLWLSHRHNRKLFCLDPQNGKVNWVIRTENETFSPAAYGSEFWLIESDPGPLGHWSDTRHQKYFFSRYDPARERILERLVVPFVPHCMALDGERFWYSEAEKKGFSSTKKDFRQL